MDFQDAELRLVIAALAEAGALNVTFGDLPSRRITLRLRQPVSRESVLPLLKSIAQSNGLRVTEESGLVHVDVAASGPEQPSSAIARSDSAEGVRLFVYRLKHAQAARLAATLQAVFGTSGPGLRQATSVAAPPLSEHLRQQRIAPVHADSARQSASAPFPSSSSSGPSLPGQLAEEVQIVPDETTNSLLVRAQPTDYAVIRQAVDAMDVRPLQVLIEVVIAEVRRTRELDVSTAAKAAYTTPGRDAPSETGELKGTPGDFVLTLARMGRVDVAAAISALATRGEVRILSRPLLFAQNNREAKILVGSERPFVQVFRSLPTDAAVRDQVVQYRDVGTSLTILPTINPDGYVNLQMTQEVSTATNETQFGAPVISTRELSTHLFLRDGQTAALGGLIDRQQDHRRFGIPLLSEIPGLGALFGTTRNSAATAELFLFLTPHIVAGDDDIRRLRDGIQARSEYLKGSLPRASPLR